MSDLNKEIGKVIQWYCDNHEHGGCAWLVCKLNDIADDARAQAERIKELEGALRYMVDTSELKQGLTTLWLGLDWQLKVSRYFIELHLARYTKQKSC